MGPNMIRKRFHQQNLLNSLAALIIILASITFICNGCHTEESDAFRFVFATDIHLKPEQQAIEGFNQAIAHINSLKPKPQFIITGGDLIEDSYVKDQESAVELYDLFVSALERLDRPVYNLIGNNDYVRWKKENYLDSAHPDFGKGMFRSRLGEGKTFSSFDHGGWRFILLDSLDMTEDDRLQGYINPDQIRWLKDELERAGKEKPVCVALHIPLLSIFTQLYKSLLAEPPEFFLVKNATEVIDLLSAYNVKLVLQGHLHLVEELKYKNITYITGGSVSGFKWRGPSFGHPEGFVIVDVKGDDFSWKYESYGWTAQPKE
jgi:3',5'-cyclic AMP phosphodiesterase CpdA